MYRCPNIVETLQQHNTVEVEVKVTVKVKVKVRVNVRVKVKSKRAQWRYMKSCTHSAHS
jgi:hypothetical protein